MKSSLARVQVGMVEIQGIGIEMIEEGMKII